MTEKKSETFKDVSITDELRQTILNGLKEEGFTEEQLNPMDSEKVWNLYVDNLNETAHSVFSELTKTKETSPQFGPIVDPMIKIWLEQLRTLTDSLEKEFEKRKAEKKE